MRFELCQHTIIQYTCYEKPNESGCMNAYAKLDVVLDVWAAKRKMA